MPREGLNRERGRLMWKMACSRENNVERISRMDGLTKEDMGIDLLMDYQNPLRKYVARAIQVHCRTYGVHGRDRMRNKRWYCRSGG